MYPSFEYKITCIQVCTNGTRVFVHKNIKKEFVRLLVEKVKAIRVGDPLDDATQNGAMVSDERAQRVLDYVATARQEVCLGDKSYIGF